MPLPQDAQGDFEVPLAGRAAGHVLGEDRDRHGVEDRRRLRPRRLDVARDRHAGRDARLARRNRRVGSTSSTWTRRASMPEIGRQVRGRQRPFRRAIPQHDALSARRRRLGDEDHRERIAGSRIIARTRRCRADVSASRMKSPFSSLDIVPTYDVRSPSAAHADSAVADLAARRSLVAADAHLRQRPVRHRIGGQPVDEVDRIRADADDVERLGLMACRLSWRSRMADPGFGLRAYGSGPSARSGRPWAAGARRRRGTPAASAPVSPSVASDRIA